MKHSTLSKSCFAVLASAVLGTGLVWASDGSRAANSAGAVPADLAAQHENLFASRSGLTIAPSTPDSLGVLNAHAINNAASQYTIFDVAVPEVLPNIAPAPPTGAFINAMVYLGGSIFVLDSGNAFWEIDPATGAILDSGTMTAPSGGETWSSIALDPTTGIVYGGATNVTTSSLHTIDFATGTATPVGAVTNSPGLIGMAADGAGNLWGYDLVTDMFLSINKATGAGTVVGPLGFDANFGQGMDWEPTTDTIYLVAFNNAAFAAELRTADRTTGATTLVGTLGSTTPGGLNQLGSVTFPSAGGGGDEYCATPAANIPDNNPAGANFTITVPDSGTVEDVDVMVDATHSWVGDLAIRLTHVGTGTSVTFYDRPGVPDSTFGCSGDNLPAVVGDDEGTDGAFETSCLNATPAFTPDGHYTGNAVLSAFDGLSLAGDWTLNVSDNAGGDTGALAEWCLIVGSDPAPPTEPDIAVDPASLASTQAPDTTVDLDLDITNNGDADLDWTIDEAEPARGTGAIQSLGSRVRYDPLRGGWISAAADLVGTGVRSDPDYTRATDQSLGGFGAILDQAPNQVNGLFIDVTCGLCGTGQQSIAENFVVTASVALQQIRLWTGYFPSNTPTTTDLYTVILHTDAAGLPGAAIYTESNVASTRVQTGVVLFGVDEWLTTLTLAAPQNLAPGTYWLEIFNDSGAGGSPDDVFWETGDLDATHGILNNAFAQQTPGTTWLAGNPIGDSAVQLDGPAGPCSSPTDVAWLSLDTTSGTTVPAATDTVTVTLDSAGLAPGVYEALLCVNSNDPDTPQVEVPVTLTVEVTDTMPFLDGFESGDTSEWSVTQN